MRHGISAALLGVLILLPATPASAQSRNDFAYWDTSGNGDLTCTEAEDRDEGLRLPAYRDNRDGTGIIYEWLERSRSSDGNNDGVACDSASNPNGYIPNAQVEPPVEPQACSADAETWHGLQVCDERPRGGYDRDAFGTGYSNLEDDIIAVLPPTMKATGQVYTPYSCLAFDITADGTAATDIEHIVALAETHDSGIADERRRDIASDLDNLTIADPTVNRSEKSDRDAAEWMPARHGAWFAERVIQVKLEYGLSVDPAERDALEALLADGDAQLNCVGSGPNPVPSPTPTPTPQPTPTPRPPGSPTCLRDNLTACLLGGSAATTARGSNLGDGRFKVTVDMWDFSGNYFPGMVQHYDGVSSETDQSVAFYSFNEGNVEIDVKMVDACTSGFNSFFVFASGGTNAQTRVTITDTFIDQVYIIDNPANRIFVTTADTKAFKTCDALPGGDPLRRL